VQCNITQIALEIALDTVGLGTRVNVNNATEHKLKNIQQDIKKAFILFNKKDNSSSTLFATISNPEPVDDICGDYFCYVSIDALLPDKTKIFGIDAFHAVVVSVKFVERFLSGPFAKYEIQNSDGTIYQPLDLN